MTIPRSLDTTDDKSSIRRQVKAWRGALDPSVRAERSGDVCIRVAHLVRGLGPVGLYAAVRGEVDVDRLVDDPSIDAAYPVTDPRARWMGFYRVETPPSGTGAYGIREPATDRPVPPESLAAVLVPGLAFSRDGHRIGYGGGFYDRFLATLPAETLTIGIAFDEQLVERVPIDPWDVPLTHVVTDHQTVTVATTTGPGAED